MFVQNCAKGIRATNKTPFVWFSSDGNLSIRGRSIPEEGSKFYSYLFEWIQKYMIHPSPSTVLSIELEYLNDITAKYLLQIIKELNRTCPYFTVEWIYEKGDIDIMEMGEILESSSEAHFVFYQIIDN